MVLTIFCKVCLLAYLQIGFLVLKLMYGSALWKEIKCAVGARTFFNKRFCMKNVIRLVGIIALMAAIMFSMTGCEMNGAFCKACGGSGECQSCHGAGKINNVQCTNCNGSGKCPRCNGTGQRPDQGGGPIW